MYVRVCVAVMLHEMARLSKESGTPTEHAESYRTFGQAVLTELLTLAVSSA